MITNRRSAQRIGDDYLDIFATFVNPDGLTEIVAPDQRRYLINGSAFNAFIDKQTAERVAAGDPAPVMAAIPFSALTLVS